MRQPSVVIEAVEDIDDLLGPADRERGDEQLSLAIDAGVFNNSEELFFGDFFFVMEPVAIGGLTDEIVTLREELRRREYMAMLAPYVSGIAEPFP
jgi:hypothetical protein